MLPYLGQIIAVKQDVQLLNIVTSSWMGRAVVIMQSIFYFSIVIRLYHFKCKETKSSETLNGDEGFIYGAILLIMITVIKTGQLLMCTRKQ